MSSEREDFQREEYIEGLLSKVATLKARLDIAEKALEAGARQSCIEDFRGLPRCPVSSLLCPSCLARSALNQIKEAR